MTNQTFEGPEVVLARQIPAVRYLVHLLRTMPEGPERDELAVKVTTLLDNTEVSARMWLQLHGREVPDVH